MLGTPARRSVRAVDVCLRSRAGYLRAFRTNVPAASSLEIPAGTISGGAPRLQTPAPDLANPRIAFQASSSYELARGVAVLTACNQPWLVRNAETVLSLSRRWLGPLTDWLLRHTVFAHFVAGETPEEIKPLLARLHSCGVGGILDYAAEADLTSAGPATETAAAAMRVSAPTNQPARIFEYQSEAQCDANMRTFLSCVAAVRDAAPEGFAAVKVTALGDPQLLARASSALLELQRFFRSLDADGDGALSRDEFVRGWRAAFLPPHPPSGTAATAAGTTAVGSSAAAAAAAAGDGGEAAAHARFDAMDTQHDGTIDVVEWTQSLPLEALPLLVQRCRQPGPLSRASLDAEEVEALRRMLGRLDAIAACANEQGVRLMVDAEHSYFQPAIDHAVLRLQRTHNRGASPPVIFNTYQAYLTDCMPRLRLDLERSRREGWQFGAKLVRGAYMEHERARAAALGYGELSNPARALASASSCAYAWAGTRTRSSLPPRRRTPTTRRRCSCCSARPGAPARPECPHVQSAPRPERQRPCTRASSPLPLPLSASSPRARLVLRLLRGASVQLGTPRAGPSISCVYGRTYPASRPEATWLMVATHNEASITHAAGALLSGAATVPPRQALSTATAIPPCPSSAELGPLAWDG